MSDQSSHEQPSSGNSSFISPQAIPFPPAPAWPVPVPTTDLVQALHMSLDIEVIVERFARIVGAQVRHDGYRFRHAEYGIEIDHGRPSRHECGYRLSLQQEYLGEILFFRGRRFQPPELQKLECFLTQLLFPIRNALLYRKAVQAAQSDSLTGLYNRAALDRMLPREIATAARAGEALLLFVLDLDHFKRINDQFGHSIGDEVLQRVSDCLRAATRESDLVFRCGGEEFVVLMRVQNAAQGNSLGQRILDMIRNCDRIQNLVSDFSITASIGWAVAAADESPRGLFDRADRAMYVAKNAGRDFLVAAH